MPHSSSTRVESSKHLLVHVGQERPAIPAHLLEPPAGMGDAVEVWGGWLWDRQGTYMI